MPESPILYYIASYPRKIYIIRNDLSTPSGDAVITCWSLRVSHNPSFSSFIPFSPADVLSLFAFLCQHDEEPGLNSLYFSLGHNSSQQRWNSAKQQILVSRINNPARLFPLVKEISPFWWHEPYQYYIGSKSYMVEQTRVTMARQRLTDSLIYYSFIDLFVLVQ